MFIPASRSLQTKGVYVVDRTAIAVNDFHTAIKTIVSIVHVMHATNVIFAV